MPNRSFNATGVPSVGASGASAIVRNEFAAVAAGFAKIEQEIDSKVFASSASSEWVSPARVPTYISGTQFRWAGSDITTIMVPHRRVRCTVNGGYVYSEVLSSAYVGGQTIVNLLDPILTSLLTLVEYATVTPFDDPATSISTASLRIYTDIGGSGNKCSIGVRYTGLDDAGAKMFAIVPIPV